MTFFKLLVIYAQLHSVISWCLYNSFSQSTAQINEVDWSPDGQYFSVASDVATVYQFNTLTPIWSQNYSNTVNTAKFSKLGKYFAVGTNANDTIFIYNVPSFTLYESLSAFAANAEQVNEVDFSPDDTKIVACGSNTYVSVVTITDVTNPYLSFTSKMVQSGKSVLTCKYSDVNDIIGLVCTGCNSDNQFLYSSNLTTLTTTSWNNGNTFYDADFQPNSNNTLYSAEGGGANKTLLVMTPTGVSSFSNTNYGNNIYAVSCAHDLSYIAIGMKKNFAIISTASKAIDFISNYTIPIWAVRASNNSNYVVVGTSTGSVDIYKRICPTCQIGSYESQSQCVLCSQSIVGCSSCKNASFCYSCYLGYFLDASNGCTQCQAALQGCEFCYNSSVCQKCDSSYYLSGNICIKCNENVPYCQQCDNNGSCIKCGYIHYLINSSCQMCSDILPNCIHCYQAYDVSVSQQNPPYCLLCRQGYYASSQGKCIPCPPNCIYCNNSTCSRCAHQYQLNPTTGNCTICGIVNCLTCNHQGTQCIQCAPSTTNTNINVCSPCSSPCVTCSNTASTCMSCEVGYFLNATNCLKCLGCSICDLNGICLQCPIGQYFDSVSNHCALCLNVTSHCAICSVSVCLACERNFVLNGNVCSPIIGIPNCMVYQKNSTNVCEHCIVGYYVNAANFSCLNCPSNCEICNNESNCLSCILEYYFNSSNLKCQPCVSPCVTCNSSLQCLSCESEYYLNGSLCVSCRTSLPNCYKCLNEFVCINCQLGYYITNVNICAICTSPCASCSGSSNNCLSCIIGYDYDYSQNHCYSCPVSCATCKSSNCTSCIAGYALNQTLPNAYSCVNCSLLYSDCQYCNSTNCLFCNSYFMLNSSNVCQQCNISNCIQCDNVGLCQRCSVGFHSDGLSCKSCSSVIFMCEKCANEIVCDKCMIGYYVNTVNSCSKCMVGCVVCDEPNICITCEVGFVHIDGMCKTCAQVTPGCSMCNQADGCLLCSNGFYYDSGNCSLCRNVMKGCANCNSDSQCLSCDGGYFMNSSNRCEQCSSQPGCEICNQTNQICTVCSSAYFLNATNQCQLCSMIDKNCVYCNSSVCLTCKTGYYLSLDICQPCETVHQFCTICNATNCFECLSGFYIPSLSSDCQQCNIVGCSMCSSNGTVCLSCSNLYYMVGNVCHFCEDSDFGCLTCNGQNQCLICKSGYFLNASDGVCVLCSQGCSMCSSQMCIICESNYFINVSNPRQSCSICQSFVDGCQLCLNQTHCLSCDLGYYMNAALLCQPCTECMVCSDSQNCLLCQVGSYLSNGKCLLCSTAIQGCFSCATPQVCQSCSGNFIINEGKCVSITSTISTLVLASDATSTMKIFCEYISQTSLKITVYTENGKFYKTQQNWNNVVTVQLATPPVMNSIPIPLTINDVSWGSSSPLNSLSFYTDNPLGNINLGAQGLMPLFGSYTNGRLLITLQQLNIDLNFNMKRAVINELMPSLDTNGNDLTLSYNLNNAQFYKSILQHQTQYYWLFGMTVTIVFIVLYLIKVCWAVPSTKDAGETIPHVLLMKVPAMVIYPSFAEYINYCYGFSIIDFPMLNSYFSEKLTQQSDQCPPSYKMFYNNLNIASTYSVPLLVFTFIITPITAITIFHKYSKKNQNRKKVGNQKKNQSAIDDQNSSYIDYIFSIILNSQSLVYNIFIAGLAFHSSINLIGIILNPNSVISIGGFFYILGVFIFAFVLIDAIRSFYSANQQCNKLRVVIKAMFMAFMYMSPIPLFAGMVVVDVSMMMYEYNVKLKQWVIPKLWLVSQFSCLIGYASLIFLSNMQIGVMIASLCILFVIMTDLYLHYNQYLEVQKMMILKKMDISITQQSFSIENYQPDKNELFNKKRNQLFFEDKQLLKKQNQQYKNNKNNLQQNYLYYQIQQNNICDLQKYHTQSQQNVLKLTEQYRINNL